MDFIIREHLSAAENQQDAEALLKAYRLIKSASAGKATDVPENFSPDLYVLCAEQALQLGNLAESKDCLQLYFKSNPPQNQFFGRSYLCKAQLHTPQSAKDVDQLEKSVVYYLKAIDFGKQQKRYYFLVFNASVIYWQMVQPFLKPGSRHLLISSLSSVVKALTEIDETDHAWRAQLMMELLECLLDAQKMKEAADFASGAAEYIKKNVPGKYPNLFAKMVQHKLIDSAKAAKETKSCVTLSVILKIQKLKSLQTESTTTKDIFTNLHEIYNLLTSSEENISISEKTSLLIELAHLTLELKSAQLAASCIKNLKKSSIAEPGTQIVLECLQCELEALNLGTKIALYKKGVVETQLKLIRRLETSLLDANRLADPSTIQTVCSTLWNLCLPLLQHNLRKHVRKPLVSIAESLEEIDSLLTVLRCQIHLEVAQIEEDEDHIESAIKHIQKALIFDDGAQYQKYLNSYLHRLQLRAMLYSTPEGLEDRAAMIIEQAKQASPVDSVRKKRSLLVNAGLCLAPDVLQMVLDSENEAKVSAGKGNKGQISYLCTKAQHHAKCVQKTEGHLKRIEDKNATERIRLWADLAKVARKQEVWDVCRAACRFCLLYDDGRWSIQKKDTLRKTASATNSMEEGKGLGSEVEPSKTKTEFTNERVLLRTLAEIRFINAEAAIHLLKSENCKLNENPIPPEDTRMHPVGYTAINPEDNPEWIVYSEWISELSRYATENFLQAAELGVELHEAWITHNAAVYILNHNKHLISTERLSELTDSLQKLLTALKKTGHNGNTVLLAMLSNALAKGLILRWIPGSAAIKKDASLHSAKVKKAPGKGSEKSNVAHVLSIDPTGFSDIKLALEVCEYVLDLTNGKMPEEMIPISVQQQILATWVKSKQLLQQQIGPKLGTEEEENNEGQNSMTRVLVAIEMHSCNGLGLMDFTVPSLSQVFDMTCQCHWSDPFVELQVLTRLAHFAYNAHGLDLALRCTQRALELEKKLQKRGMRFSILEHEMLSMAACVQGQSIMDNLAGKKHLRISAIKAFQLSARFAGEAGNFPLALQAARHFWNACYPLTKSSKEREPLKEATTCVIKALTDAESKKKQQSENNPHFYMWPTMDATDHAVDELESQGDSSRHDESPDEEQKLRASLYELLFNMYADKNEWEAGLKVLDEAIQVLPRTKHRLVIFKHRLLVKARLGHNFFMDIQKFKDENEDYLAYIWHHVSLMSTNTSEQLTCYLNAIDVLQKTETQWQKVEYLFELAEWLYCKQFPVSHALNILDWAVDILLQMRFNTSTEEDKNHKGKTRPSRKSARTKDQKRSESVKVDETKTEDGEVVETTCKSIEDLRNVRQLEALTRAHTIMAVISGHSSPLHKQHCLMACTYIMRIWQVSLPAAASFVKALPKRTTPSQKQQSASSRKEKIKKEAPETAVIKEKPKKKGSVDALPSNTEEWAGYDCAEEIRDAFKQDTSYHVINRSTIGKPTYTLYYLDLLIKELQSISFTHLTLPVLQFAEVIAHDVVESSCLSILYHLRISQICTDLRLFQAATYHEKAVGNTFITEQEQISCRQELLQHKEKKKNEHQMEENNVGKEKILRLHEDGKGISGMSLPYLWMEKADVLIQLGYFQPARLLLSEAYKSFQETGDRQDQSKCLYLLSVLANSERNHGQAQALLKEIQQIERTTELWYRTTISMTEAVLGENKDGKEKQACKILETAMTALNTMLQKQSNREAQNGLFMASLHVRKLSIDQQVAQALMNSSSASPSHVTVKMLEICDEMRQIENDLLRYGHKEKRAEVMTERSNALRILASSVKDEEDKHRYFLDAYFTAESAINLQEEILFNIQSLFPQETGAISLPAARKLANMKLHFAELSLEIIQLVSTEQRKKLQDEKRKGRLCVAVEEFVRATPDYNSIEQEWKSLGLTVASTTLSQLANVLSLASDCAELKAKCLYLTGKCLYLLSVKVDPLGPDMFWNENTLAESKVYSAVQDYSDFEQPTEDQWVKKAAELKQKRAAAQMFLAQASEILLQSLNVSIYNNLLSTLSAASIQLCSCLGVFDPVSAGQFLALHQSSASSIIMKNMLSSATHNTSNSQFAALLNLQQFLQKQGNTISALQGSIENRLSDVSPVWENLHINKQFFNIFNELPSDFTVVVLQQSEDRAFLYGAVLEKPKANTGPKGKVNQPPQQKVQAKVVRCAVDPQMFLNLMEKMELFKQDTMQSLLRKENQQSLNRQQNLFEQIKGVNKNPEMIKVCSTEDDCEKTTSSAFYDIINALEDYLNPVLHSLDLTCIRQPSPVLSPAGSVRPKSRDKEEKPTTVSSASVDAGECIVLLADKFLMEFPLEALGVFKDDGISSISRDFSLQLLFNRLHREQTAEGETKRDAKSSKGTRQKTEQKKNIKTAPINRILPAGCIPVDTHNFKYIADPYNEAQEAEAFSPGSKMNEILAKYGQQFTPHWEGIIGSSHIPSHAEWEKLTTSCSAFLFYGMERFLAHILLDKFMALHLKECQLMILLDLVRTSHSFARQSKVDVQKRATSLTLERPVETALLLSATGIRSLMLNQWHTTLEKNAKRLDCLAENLLANGKTTGQSVHSQRRLGLEGIPLNDERDKIMPEDKEEILTREHVPVPPTRDPSVFSYVLYGLPNMVVM
ncbi:cilia- and flagella-associated protein 46 isoform X1 [Xenopus laevis]|uniref:Cilia- and flagella-associated protein 46 isoform X1 n=1 Tax=Xenopus laevis TaxID=8355 RepID=A0A8J0T9Q4_XENLA|nr:cilia- and flagella-associated protein 46 isoform X1 [Xenopus laevis]XP_018080699.1 cilia- and flagella-associated protein 46 isoform X1 [Xenopus laevis]